MPQLVQLDPLLGFCRDCLTVQKSRGSRCSFCGSPRLLRHSELYSLSLAHVDCDAFYAAVEKRDNPDLRDKPVIIGGGKRGVVATACYNARMHGVHSAMPMFKALKLCPQAIVIKPDMAKYSRVAHEIRMLMHELTPLVEPLSIDEAFLDLTGTELLHKVPSSLVLAKFARRIESEIGITVSIGLSYCKFLAKVASDLEKPRGFSVIGRSEARDFLAGQPITLIWGVGKSFAKRLAADGLINIGQLQKMDEATLIKQYGIIGKRLYALSRGNDPRKVIPERIAKSISAERTFDVDIYDRETLVAVLRNLSEKVAARLKKTGTAATTVVLKLKSDQFQTKTRSRHLVDPIQSTELLFHTGLELLTPEINGTRYRLLGIGVQQLTTQARQMAFKDEATIKKSRAEQAIDLLRERFGESAIETGYTFRKAQPHKK